MLRDAAEILMRFRSSGHRVQCIVRLIMDIEWYSSVLKSALPIRAAKMSDLDTMAFS